MRYANLHSRRVIGYGSDLGQKFTAEQTRAFMAERTAVKLATESAKSFANTVAPLVSRDGKVDRSALMRAAVRCAKARMQVTGESWASCMSTSLKGAWAAAKGSRFYKAN